MKQSSYRLNSLIITGVCLGFGGDLLYTISLDHDMSETLTTTICNVGSYSKLKILVLTCSFIGKIMDK